MYNVLPGSEKKKLIYIVQLRKGAGGARGDHAANLKPAVVSWLFPLFDDFQSPLSPVTKMDRGFEHSITGSLLCPIDYNWGDERCDKLHWSCSTSADEVYRSSSIPQSIWNGHPDFVVTADSWPAFLYPHAKADPDDMEHGLFQSALLVKV